MSRPSDIIVVGAGVVGCGIAYELARRGASVEVVDGRQIGMGATQASAGILAPYVEVREDSPLLEIAVAGLALYDEFVERVASDSGMAFSYRRSGTLDVATDEVTLNALRAAADRLSRRRVAADLLDGPTLRNEEPQLTEDVLGGLLIPAHGFVAATDLTRALASAARHHGAQLVEQRKVRRISHADGCFTVETDRGTLGGDAIVLAAGSWSRTIDIAGLSIKIPVRPVRGQLVQLAWPGAPLRRTILGSKCYLVPWDDGTVLVGATVEEAGFDERATVAGVRDLLEAACELTPRAWTAGFMGARVGLRPGTSDDLPIIGPSGVVPNLMYATGHYRNGVLLAPITAKLVATAILDHRVDPVLSAMTPTRFGGL